LWGGEAVREEVHDAVVHAMRELVTEAANSAKAAEPETQANPKT
jgi:hypothetical protein